MSRFPVELVRRFNEPAGALYRAFDHLIGARRGMTLMVPMAAAAGKFSDLVDMCPVPHLEAAAILEPDYATAASLADAESEYQDFWNPFSQVAPLPRVRTQLQEAFLGDSGIYPYDDAWRFARIRLSAGGAPCQVLIGEAGVRLAFTPDFLGRDL